MSITKEEIKSIKKYKDVNYYTTENRKITLNLRDILRYVIYWKDLISNYKGEVRLSGSSVGIVSYKQLEQLSDEELDDKSPKGILKLQSYMFMNDNKFSKDQIALVKSYIENYASFINFLEYKNPICISIAILCISKDVTKEEVEEDTTITSFIPEDIVEDEMRYDDSDDEVLEYSDFENDDDGVIEFGEVW
tara:strand:+ start:555 stop:1130 length:576 start_codon:yes stop_codon:yes gene_type:complete